MLTPKQRELLLLIHQRLQEGGVSPSFEEMKTSLGLRSKSGIHRLIRALEERGFLRRLPHRARALEILRLPDSSTPFPRSGSENFIPSVIKGGRGVPLPELDDSAPEMLPVEVMGRIAAGTPIEALQEPTRKLYLPQELFRGGEHYALEVEGDSMIEAGILNGDTVLIQKTETAMSGDIVVALVDNHEATLKRLRKRGGIVALEPANRAYEPQIVAPERMQIQGKMVGLFRQY